MIIEPVVIVEGCLAEKRNQTQIKVLVEYRNMVDGAVKWRYYEFWCNQFLNWELEDKLIDKGRVLSYIVVTVTVDTNCELKEKNWATVVIMGLTQTTQMGPLCTGHLLKTLKGKDATQMERQLAMRAVV
jgi:hypothetical protein